MTQNNQALEGATPLTRNRFDRLELAGALGDLGTLIPFTVAYITLLKMDPFGVLFAFGIAQIIAGLYYKTPFPVQPMKAIGAVATLQSAQTLVISPATVYGAGLVTGLVWLALGLTGAIRVVARLVPRQVIFGIVMGLGFSFMLEGIRMMATGWVLGTVALAGTLLLLANKRLPAMFLLLAFGMGAALLQDPSLLDQLAQVRAELRLPTWTLADLTWNDLVVGTLFLALPQVPLTLGNAIVVITEENNRLFPERSVTERKVSISTGILNLLAPAVGGVPMCHGAGGMAGHVRFGARTGGALVILGTLLLLLTLFLSSSIETLFKVFPMPVLGVILFLTGTQLALGAGDGDDTKEARFVRYATAAFAMWNTGAAFLFGIALHHLLKRGWVRS